MTLLISFLANDRATLSESGNAIFNELLTESLLSLRAAAAFLIAAGVACTASLRGIRRFCA
jgi:hypothetical protein